MIKCHMDVFSSHEMFDAQRWQLVVFKSLEGLTLYFSDFVVPNASLILAGASYWKFRLQCSSAFP